MCHSRICVLSFENVFTINEGLLNYCFPFQCDLKCVLIVLLCLDTVVKNKYTYIYLKCIYFRLCILHFHIYVPNKIPCNCTFSILNILKVC